MSVIPKQIGQSNEYALLYEILKKLDAILTGKIKVEVVNTEENPVNTLEVTP